MNQFDQKEYERMEKYIDNLFKKGTPIPLIELERDELEKEKFDLPIIETTIKLRKQPVRFYLPLKELPIKCHTCTHARFTENCTVCNKNQYPDQDCDYEEDEDCENY